MDSAYLAYTPKKKVVLWKYENIESEDKSVVVYLSNGSANDSGEFTVEGNVIRIQGIGVIFWELCDGGNTIEDMVKRIVEEYDVETEQVTQDLEAFLDNMEDMGLIIKDWAPF